MPIQRAHTHQPMDESPAPSGPARAGRRPAPTRSARRLAATLAVTTAVATALATGLGAGAAQADAEDEAWIQYRQTVMSGIGSSMGGIGDILKNGLPLTPSIEFHASALATNARLVAPAFQKKVVAGATDAKPAIWEKPDEFAAAIDDMREAAEQLAAAVAEGNTDQIGPGVKALGKTCGSCHKTFRKPKEESYKNK